ncbi:class F sortase [Streptomyces tsukubensis]|uniref:class F sortase n=1 Tax=Streptomyces tsukubensis TaxID=83656 RepID=UPI00344F47F2
MSGSVVPQDARRTGLAALAAGVLSLSLVLTACDAPFGGGDDRPGGAKAPRAMTLDGAGTHATHDVVEDKGAAGGRVSAPAEAGKVGWAATGTVPGAKGAAVLTGRIGTKTEPGPLHDIARTVVGGKAVITHADGTTTTFTVDRVQMISRQLPTLKEAARGAKGRELRIIAIAPPPTPGQDKKQATDTGKGEAAKKDQKKTENEEDQKKEKEEQGAGAEQVGLLVSATAR